nr:DUF1499 domain-containing protein [Methylobacterium sp. WL1]
MFSILATGLALILVRDPRADTDAALVALAAGLYVALAAAVAAVFAFVHVWREGARGLGAALAGLVLAILLLGYLAYLGCAACACRSCRTSPPISTTRRPSALARRLRGPGGRYPADPGPAIRERQRAAYPQIAPLTLDIGADEAFELARKAALNRHWQIVEAIRPGGRTGNGRIEAVARGLILNLPDDVTVRIRPRADGARIDVRSASRLGGRDFGTNADRIRAYLDDVANLALAVK